MKLFAKVKTGAREERVEQIDDRHVLVSVKAEPEDGKANDAVCSVVARYYHVAPSSVRIVFGLTNRQKIIEVPIESSQGMDF